MKEQLKDFINRLKADRRLDIYDEAATKQAVVLRLLSLLGWDTFDIDEVTPEYSLVGKRVDYSLRINNINKVFIEVKRIGIELGNHQEQLLNYSFQQGVKLSILTNGITWWFYLPLNEGSWEQRKFYTIDIPQQDTEDITNKFLDFMAKENINSGKAIQNAESIYRGQQKINILEETLPKAWNKIIEEADDLLIDLINETAEKICGLKADTEFVEHFLSKHRDKIVIATQAARPTLPVRPQTRMPAPAQSSTLSSAGNYTGKRITSFYFRGIRYEVRSWIDMLIKLCETINASHRSEFDKALAIVGRQRPYFTRNSNELRAPQKINNTNIYVETNLSANNIVRICFDMLTVFSYADTDLKIEIY